MTWNIAMSQLSLDCFLSEVTQASRTVLVGPQGHKVEWVNKEALTSIRVKSVRFGFEMQEF